MGKPDPPTPPNPQQTAAAQTGTNVSTGVANAFLNNVNQNTPDGSLRYDVTGNHAWTDPSTGQTYQIPTFTSTQSLSPQAQAIQSQTNAAKLNMAGMANTQSGRISDLLSTPFSPTGGAPSAGDAAGLGNSAYWAQSSYDPGGDITKSYGAGDFSQDRQNVEDSLMARMNPQLARERGGIEQRLADQGIRYGSQAYTSAMDDYNRQANDARFAAVGQAGTEQQRMMDMAAQRAGFENSAQAQQNSQNAALAGFGNAGRAQQMGQYQSLFNASNAARNQYLQEQYAQRNQPLNEISSLLGGSAVQSPNWLNSPQSQIATTDYAGITNANAQLQQQAYNTAQTGWNTTMGGILGMGGAIGGGYMKSDERVKKDIDKVGTVFAYNEDAERKGLPIYEYAYKDDPASTRHIGPMAQDVEKIDKGAVKTIGGVKHINPSRVMGNILRAA